MTKGMEKESKSKKRSPGFPKSVVRKKIDQVAFKLFMEKGYKNTTMRQIMLESGFQAGSIYYVFKDKDDILLDIVMRSYDSVLKELDKIMNSDVNFLAAISFPMAADIYCASLNPTYAELMREAHASWKISQAMIDKTIAWESTYLSKYDLNIDMQVMKANLLACSGVMYMYIQKYCNEGVEEHHEALRLCLEVFCHLFHFPPSDVDMIEEEISKLLKRDEFVLGFFDIGTHEDQ